MAERGQIKQRVLATLKNHQNIHMTAADVADEAKVERTQANQALAHLAQNLAPAVRRAGPGIYVYNPGAVALKAAMDSSNGNDRVYEGIGKTHEGDLIIRNENGELFKAVPL